ncbi:MAG TPA: peptidyl-prolyl cis-trans isomerase [Gammaproteobacteria bacterium]
MLQNIREKFTGVVALVILGAIALSFVFVGLNYSFIGQSFAAKVDGEDISLAQFENAYRDQLQERPELAQLPATIRQTLRGRILEQLIQQRVVDNYLSESGYIISDEQLARSIQQTPDFQVDGKFDMEAYRSLLAQFGQEPAGFERSQRVGLRRDQLQRAVRGSAILTPAEFRRYLNLAGEQRIVTIARLTADAVADGITITDDVVTAYYDANPSMFQLPESADVEYIEVRRADVAADISVSEEELQEYYEANKDRFLRDEQRQARHILILFGDDEAAAETLADDLVIRARSGESFEALAREYSMDGGTAEQGGDLGTLTRTQLPDALGDAIFAATEGTVEGPVKTDFGFHIIRVDQVLARGPVPIDMARGELMSELQDQKAESIYRDLERRLSDALFDARDIRALAETVGLEVKAAAGITREGGEPFGDSEAVVTAIFDERVTGGNQLSEIVEIDNTWTAVFAVTRYNPSQRQPLEDVRDQVADAVRAQQAEQLMAARAEAMLTALESGTDFAAAAESIGVTAEEPTVMTRGSQEIDQSVVVAVFAATKPTQGASTTGRTRTSDGGYTVYSIDAVIPGRPEGIPQADRDNGKLQITDQQGVGEFIALIQALRESADVVINEDALAASDLL